MNDPIAYSSEWFKKQKLGAATSAEIVLPIVLDLVSPHSVVDVGCGVGMWLAFFPKHGVKDIFGVDGSWVHIDDLHIPKDSFKAIDISKPFDIGRKADLVICLEVGEHIAKESAKDLVASLVAIAPVIMFSAAIPRQGGTNHINEQWPDYWAALFKTEGYIPVDCIRRRVWTDPNVEYWYAQNTILYVKESDLHEYPKLEHEVACGYSSTLPLVHPRKYFYALQPLPPFFFRLKRKIRHTLHSIFSNTS